MSVFADFQRMWMNRFPDNALSNEWENDVRFSLQRHKQKVVDMTKELEQEMLYVEYLERLLGDVEAFRQGGGDPAIPIQAISNDDGSGGDGGVSGGGEHIQTTASFDSNDDEENSQHIVDDIGNSIATIEQHTSSTTNGVCNFSLISFFLCSCVFGRARLSLSSGFVYFFIQMCLQMQIEKE